MVDFTVLSIPIETMQDQSLSLVTRLRLLVGCYPSVLEADPHTVARVFGIDWKTDPKKYNNFRVTVWNPVVKKGYPGRTDLSQPALFALRDITHCRLANPSFDAEKKRERYGDQTPRILIRKDNPGYSNIQQYCPGLFDLSIPTVYEFWSVKLPRTLGNTDWKAETDRDVRLSAYVMVASKYVKRHGLRDHGISFMLSSAKKIKYYPDACEFIRNAVDQKQSTPTDTNIDSVLEGLD